MTQQQTPNTPDQTILDALPPLDRPPKRKPLWLQLTLGATIALVVAGAAWAWPSLRQPTDHTVVYQGEADAAHGSGRTGSWTVQTPDGSTQGKGPLPVSGAYTFHSGDFVYLSVQNGQSTGSVTCRILVDDKVVSEVTSDGGFTIATCQGRVP